MEWVLFLMVYVLLKCEWMCLVLMNSRLLFGSIGLVCRENFLLCFWLVENMWLLGVLLCS